jgi:uncharacterized SAM-binding protein YcdF (DUF218 family)
MKALILSGAVVVAIVAAIIGAGFLISPQDELQPADAIVAVSGGDTTARAVEAVRLYQSGYAPLLIFSGAASDPQSPSNASAMREIAISYGVQPDVIALDEVAENTRQNADQVGAILRALHSRKIILVTSPYHQRRAELEFKNRLGVEIDVINHSALDTSWSKKGWWLTPIGWYYTLNEVPRVLFTYLNHQLTS